MACEANFHVSSSVPTRRCGVVVGFRMTYLIKDILQLVLRQSAALDILDRPELLGHALAVLLSYWLHLLFCQLFPHLWVVAQVHLGADNEAGDAGAVVVDLRKPLLADVLERGGRRDAEAHQEDVGLGIRQGS